jgi:hypothetical protein
MRADAFERVDIADDTEQQWVLETIPASELLAGGPEERTEPGGPHFFGIATLEFGSSP